MGRKESNQTNKISIVEMLSRIYLPFAIGLNTIEYVFE